MSANILTFAAFLALLFVISTALAPMASAKDKGSLLVPVYPRVKSEMLKKPPKDAVSALHRSYIVTEQGNVLSLGQWVMQGMKKHDYKIGSKIYDAEAMLGQAARAMAGYDRVTGVRLPKRPEHFAVPISAHSRTGASETFSNVAQFVLGIAGYHYDNRPAHVKLREALEAEGTCWDNSELFSGNFAEAIQAHQEELRSYTIADGPF